MSDDQTEKNVQAYLAEMSSRLKKREEAKKRKPSALDQVEMVLPSVLTGLGLDRKLKEHALMQVWESILPSAMTRRCRPLYIDFQQNLVIAARDAATAQELSLMKSKLLRSLSSTATSLGIDIRGLRVDMKNFHQPVEKEPMEEFTLPHQPSERDLDECDLSETDKRLITELDRSLIASGRPDETRFRVVSSYEKQLRLANWRRLNGYPLCQLCNSPVTRLFAHKGNKVCFNCSLAEQT